MGDAVPLVGLDAAAGRDALMRLMSYATVFWLAWRLAQEAQQARRLLAVILGTITACAAYAAYGLVVHLAGWETIGWLPKTTYIGDVTGTFVNRNSFATYANLGVVICLGLLAEPFLAARGLADIRRIATQAVEHLVARRSLIVLALAVLAIASLQSHSRGGLLSLGPTVVVLVLLLFLVTRPRLVTALAVLVPSVLAGWGLLSVSGGITLERLGQIDGNYDVEAAGRLTYWQISLDMVADRPWEGHGYGNSRPPSRSTATSGFPTGSTWRTTLTSSTWSSSAWPRRCSCMSGRSCCSAIACVGCSRDGGTSCSRW